MRRFPAATLAALLLPQPLPGQPPSTLTEAEFLAPLDDSHPAVLVLARELAAARAGVVAARTLENPELGALREDPTGSVEQLDVTVSWRPPHPGRRRLAIAASEAEVDAAAHRLDEDLLGLELHLREVYGRWALAVARGDRLAGQAARIDALAARERHRAESGESSGLDARRLALAAVETRAALARAGAEADTASAAARAWRPDLPDGVRPALPELPDLGAAPDAVHPRIAALEAELAAARRERELVARVVGMPEVVAGWQRQDGGTEVAEGPILGLAWPVPLFDRNRSERLSADARVREVSARLELARRRLAAEREGRRAAYRRLREAALDATAAADAGGPAVEAATAAFRLGEMDLTDLLETLRSSTAAELAALELREAALAAGRELVRVAPRSLAQPPLFQDHRAAEDGPPGRAVDDDPSGDPP
jgi:cobalt-zinc-cadmium efflux system outer membrane protein